MYFEHVHKHLSEDCHQVHSTAEEIILENRETVFVTENIKNPKMSRSIFPLNKSKCRKSQKTLLSAHNAVSVK